MQGIVLILDGYASAAHYAAHLVPIWDALPAEVRGAFYAPRASDPWGEPLPPRWPRDRIVLVASYVDALKCRPRSLVYVEHGAGQAYPGDARSARNPSYSGGDSLENVILFLCPSETVAARWRERYPAVPVAVVGCPKLDPWHRRMAAW